jgi:hypothetical protein
MAEKFVLNHLWHTNKTCTVKQFKWRIHCGIYVAKKLIFPMHCSLTQFNKYFSCPTIWTGNSVTQNVRSELFFQNTVLIFYMPILYPFVMLSNTILHHKVNGRCFIYSSWVICMNEYILVFLYRDLVLYIYSVWMVAIFVSNRILNLSQWFIMRCLWVYYVYIIVKNEVVLHSNFQMHFSFT